MGPSELHSYQRKTLLTTCADISAPTRRGDVRDSRLIRPLQLDHLSRGRADAVAGRVQAVDPSASSDPAGSTWLGDRSAEPGRGVVREGTLDARDAG